jgi:hypothetical protein
LTGQLFFALFFSALLALEAGAQGSSGAPASVPTGVIVGTVTDASGAIVAGAHVTAGEESTMKLYRTTTNSSGAYRLTALDPGKYSVRAGMREFGSKTQRFVVVRASRISEVDIRLDIEPESPEIGPAASLADVLDPDWPPLESFPFGVISGLVADPQGQPVSQVRVGVVNETTGSRYETATKCTGRYRRSRLEPGRYTVRFEAEGFRPAIKTGVRLSADVVTHLDTRLDLRAVADFEIEPHEAQPSGLIRGTVTDPTGAALPTRITAIHTTSGKSFDAKTDSNGIYRFYGLPVGNFTVSFGGGVEAITKQEVLAGPSPGTCVDVRAPVEKQQAVVVCTASCPIQLWEPAPPYTEGMVLQIYTQRTVITKGSDLWLTVVLRNTTAHPILVQADPGGTSVFAFEIYAHGSCGCPGWLGKRATGASSVRNGQDQSPGSNLLVPPGGSITGRVDLGPILSRNPPDLYTIAVQEPYAWSVENSVQAAPLITSNGIMVRVVPAF